MENIIITQISKEELISEIVEKITDIVQRPRVENTLLKKEYLSRKEVAELLNISLTTIHDWTYKKGILKGQKIGNRLLYRTEDVLDSMKLIESRKTRKG